MSPEPESPDVAPVARPAPDSGDDAHRIFVGWREWVALPALGIEVIKAKIDTGARSSALHAHEIRYVRRGERRFVRFRVYPNQKDDRTFVEARGEWLEDRRVRSSSGVETVRPVIRTVLEMGGDRWPIELTLTRRDAMGFRLLLGRQALKGRCLVDPGASFLTQEKDP
jgi:hypothetical protein